MMKDTLLLRESNPELKLWKLKLGETLNLFAYELSLDALMSIQICLSFASYQMTLSFQPHLCLALCYDTYLE
jgi:hypothetical protein